MELAEPLRRARDAHRAGRLDEARRGYEEALAADANNADALHLLGVLNHQSGDAAAAIDFVNRAIDARPGFAEALNNRGAFHQAAGDLAAAMDDFQAAVHIDANFADAWLNLGCLTRVRDGADAALAPLRSAVTAAPEMVEALDALGECLGALGRRDEALAAFERALAVDATHAATLCNKGRPTFPSPPSTSAASPMRCGLSRPLLPGNRTSPKPGIISVTPKRNSMI